MKIYGWLSILAISAALSGCGTTKETTGGSSAVAETSNSPIEDSKGNQAEYQDYIFLELNLEENIAAIKDYQGEFLFSNDATSIGMESFFVSSVEVSEGENFSLSMISVSLKPY